MDERTRRLRSPRTPRRLARGATALRVGALLAVHAASATLLSAQTPAPEPARAPAVVRYGKWTALGLAAGFTILGATTHDRADQRYRELLAFCRVNGSCAIGPDGRYAYAAAESLYQRVVRNDRSARAWLVSGQAAIVAGAVLFVIELKRDRGTENIPFAPYVAAGPLGTRAGVRIALGRRGARRE